MAKSIISNNPAQLVTKARANLTDWSNYTPVFGGLGTVTVEDFEWRQVGQNIQVRGKFTAGTTTASEVQIGLPNSYTVGGSVSGVLPHGECKKEGSSNTRLHLIATQGDAFVNMGAEFRTAASDPMQIQNGSAIINSGEIWTMYFEVPVAELSGSDVTFLSAQPTQRVAYLKDVKPSGTNGGTATSGSYQTRELNTVEGSSEIVALSSNQFTLGKGEYDIVAFAPAIQVDNHKIKLRNITDSTDDIIGKVTHSKSTLDMGNDAKLSGKIVITSSKTFEVQHRCATTKAINGFGEAASFGDDEVYTTVKITKLK